MKGNKTYLWIESIIAIIVVLFFSYTTSPLFPHFHGWDSAFFQLVGAGMTKGMLPYRDFFDMKGPWLFMIESIGQLIGYGRNGIFAIQCIGLFVVLYFCHRIDKQFYDGRENWEQILKTIPLLLVLSVTMEGGNLTEELCLPLLFLTLYFAMKYILGESAPEGIKGVSEHNPRYAIVYGLCFGVIALIRITNTVLICAVVAAITVFLIVGRKWYNLLLNAIAFLAGVLVAFIPPIIYFGYHGLVEEMLYCTFVFGFTYGTESFAYGAGAFYFVTLFFPIAAMAITKEKNSKLWTLVSMYIVGMILVLGMGTSTFHDYTLIIPGVMIGIWQLSKNKVSLGVCGIPQILVIAVLVVCFAYPTYKFAGEIKNGISRFGEKEVWNNAVETLEYIPEEERDSVWGYEVPLRWYTITDIMPYNRYCGWQEHYMRLVPEIEEEIKQMMQEAPPKWIVTKATAELTNEMMRNYLQKNYLVVKENSDFTLYKLQ